MMDGCRKIEALLYLFRDGERTPGEERAVREHVARCPRCEAVLRSVEALATGITAAADAGTEPLPAPGLVGRTLAAIGDGATHRGRPLLPAAARPAAAFIAIALCILAGQLARDAWQTAETERRIAARVPGSEAASFAGLLSRLADIATPGGARSAGPGVVSASAIPRFLIPRFGGDDFFGRYAGRFPLLAGIDPGDGIDERERGILLSEGKQFLEEFQRLIDEGGKAQ